MSEEVGSTAALLDLFCRNAELTSKDLKNYGRAETTVATAHTCSYAALNSVERSCTNGTMDRLNDLGLSDLLATADEVTVKRIFLNESILLSTSSTCEGSEAVFSSAA